MAAAHDASAYDRDRSYPWCSAVAATRDTGAEPPQPDRATQLGEGLGGRVATGRIGPGGEVGGRQLRMAQAHARLLEQKTFEAI